MPPGPTAATISALSAMTRKTLRRVTPFAMTRLMMLSPAPLRPLSGCRSETPVLLVVVVVVGGLVERAGVNAIQHDADDLVAPERRRWRSESTAACDTPAPITKIVGLDQRGQTDGVGLQRHRRRVEDHPVVTRRASSIISCIRPDVRPGHRVGVRAAARKQRQPL